MNENEKIEIELSIKEINLILNALGNLPYIQVVEFIDKLKQSATVAIQAKQQAPAVSE